jgi:acyl-CoA synthetase (NDP forming)
MAGNELARALLAPQSIALIGASGDEGKNTARPLRYLRNHGFRGRVFPVNATRSEVLGEKAWPDLKSAAENAGAPIDHAYVMVPTAAVPGVIADCAGAGVKVATVYSDGFAEIGPEGLKRQNDLVAVARKGGVRLLGPNSMGVVNLHGAMAMTTNAALEAPGLNPGPFSVISQSGTALGSLLSRGQERGFGFSKLLSIGLEADLSVGEIVDFLADDPETGAILLFLEALRRSDQLAAAARKAYRAGKPVIALKIGRSDAGRQMVVSHSGALAGPDEAAAAFFRHNGIVRVDTLEALFETPFLVAGRKPAETRRVAVMTTTGGGAAMVIDRLGMKGVEFIPPPPKVTKRLTDLGVRVGDGPVIDLTMAGAGPGVYGPMLRDLIDAGECDAVVCIVGSSAQHRPDLAVDPIIAEAPEENKSGGGIPVAVFCVPEAGESLKKLTSAGMAGFRTPESCADAVSAFLDFRPPAETLDLVKDQGPDMTAAESLLTEASSSHLDTAASLAVFAALGIDHPPHRVLAAGDAPDGPNGINYPVAAKVLSADIPHKTESGGVVLDIGDDAALRDAVASILAGAAKAHPEAGVAGVLVQKMETGLAEALIGYRWDAEAGPVVVLGAGGILTELYDDAAVRVAPVNRETALAMIGEVRGLATVRGYRGLPEGDLEALAAAIEAVSWLACAEGRAVLEAEINPLVVRPKGQGAVALDGLIVVGK